MAATEGFGGRSVGRLIGWLAVPRVVTLPVLLLLGAGMGELAWQSIGSAKILAWASGMASPFCMLCATAVWAMRDRLDDVVDTDAMSSEEFQRFDSLASQHRARSMTWAAISALMALLASGPAVSNQLIGPVWHWMVLGSGAAVGCSVYSYLMANHWEKQIRAYKIQQRIAEKKQREKDSLIENMMIGRGVLRGDGWVQGPTLSPPVRHHH